jgi:alpha-D-xyloside xylohydrolase
VFVKAIDICKLYDIISLKIVFHGKDTRKFLEFFKGGYVYMIDIDSSDFPQKIDNQNTSTLNHNNFSSDLRGPTFFKEGENVVFVRPFSINSYTVDKNRISLACKTKGFLHRTVQTHETSMHQMKELGDASEIFYIDIEIWSSDVFRIKYCKSPLLEVKQPQKLRTSLLIGQPEENIKMAVNEDDKTIQVMTDDITLQINKEVFCMKAYDKKGEIFWEQVRSDLFTSDILDISFAKHRDRTCYFESFQLENQDEIYGLGERFDHVTRKGKKVDFWNKDAIGTSNPRTYINVPFLISTQGYGLFVNSSCRTEWEIGTMDASALGFAVEDDLMDYFVIYGPTPKEILYKYCQLTGFSPTPPVWSFGLWMSRNSYLSWDVVFEVADELRKRDIPCDVLHLDPAWFTEDWNCDLKFSPERFPNPEENIRKLKEKGFRISLWQYNFVPPKDNNENYLEGVKKGYFATMPNGKLFSYPEETIGMWLDDAIIDFSNPEACDWYAEQIKGLIRKGAAAIKTDFGEGIPENAIYKNIEGRRFHNLYSLIYNSLISDAIYEVKGERIVWGRSGTAGSQRYPLHWGGDSQCNWSGLSGTVRGALSIGLSGFPFYSHDIGGFIGKPTPELYIRWAQFGFFSSHSRCHGAGNHNSREPWTYGEEAENIFRKFAKLKYRLMPYIYNEARKSSKTALPMVRALIIEYPEDRNVMHIDDQYMFGDSLLIAPILSPIEKSKTRKLYLPKGKWFDYWTKEEYESRGEWIEKKVDLQTIPIYVKAGSVIPYGAEKQTTNNEIGQIELLELYMEDDFSFNYDDGITSFKVIVDHSNPTVEGLDYSPKIIIYGKERG